MLSHMADEQFISASQQEVHAAKHKAAQVHRRQARSNNGGLTSFKDQEIMQQAEEVMDDERDDVDRETIFDNLLEAIEYRNLLVKANTIEDASIPQTTEQMKACVKLLFKAFKSTVKAGDHEAMKKPFNQHRHDNCLVEALCWDILHKLIKRSQSQNPLTEAFDSAKARENQKIESFAQRFDATVEALAGSKTICKHLFDPPYLNIFIDDPLYAYRRVETNRLVNESKAAIIKAGKDVKKQQTQDDKPAAITPKRRKVDEIPVTPRKVTEHTSRTGALISTPETHSSRKRLRPLIGYEDNSPARYGENISLFSSPIRGLANTAINPSSLRPIQEQTGQTNFGQYAPSTSHQPGSFSTMPSYQPFSSGHTYVSPFMSRPDQVHQTLNNNGLNARPQLNRPPSTSALGYSNIDPFYRLASEPEQESEEGRRSDYPPLP